jgi:cell cycle sensor histidine kinase DivJ
MLSRSPAALGLAVASLGGAAGAILVRRRGAGRDGAVLLAWAVSVTVAMLLCGGLAGPLPALALAPIAAATILGGSRNLAAGAALAAVALAVAGLADAARLTALAPQPLLTVFAVSLMAGAQATALAIAGRRRGAAVEAARTNLRRPSSILGGQGLVILDLADDGGVREAFGTLFEPLTFESLAGGFDGLTSRPEDAAQARAKATTEGRAEFGFAPALAPDRWILATLTAGEDGAIAVLRDETGERSRQILLERSAAEALSVSEGKSRFLANMSHELRTPLNAVVGFSDIMRSQMFGPLAPKYAEYAELIHESGGHLLDLINDVLDLSKIEAERYELSLEAFDAREAVSAALRLVRVQADSSGIGLRGVLGPEPVKVKADRRALKQIVLNLASNALKFTPTGGFVTVGLRSAQGALELAVGDTGVGISTEDLERLGRPYQQAGDAAQRAKGSGLGLSLVRALSELHGGEMTISSTLGSGTIVVVRLPVIAEDSAEAEILGAPIGENIIAFNPKR